MIAVDPKARSSTLQDLDRGRRTETDEFQGAIVRLAREVGTTAPLSRLVLERIRAAEAAGKGSPRLTPDDLKSLGRRTHRRWDWLSVSTRRRSA